MLDKIKKFIGKSFLTVLVLLLVLSFSIWGVGDVIRGQVDDTVAEVDGVEISKEQLRYSVSYEMKRLQQAFAGDTSIFDSLNIENIVLQSLINKVLFALETDRLGLELGNKSIVNTIASDRRFYNSEGKFDKRLFEGFLRQIGKSESAFFTELKNDLEIELLLSGLTEVSFVPSSQVEQIRSYDGEKRRADLLVIPADYVTKVPEPTTTELIEYYDQKKEEFSAPEYRNISYITIGTEDVINSIDVSEDTLRQEYEDNISDFKVDEKRTIEQILIPSEEEAKEAYKLLSTGKSFSEVAKIKFGLKKDSLEYGEFTKDDLVLEGLIPEDVADNIFLLKNGSFTKPQQSSFGWHIFKVVKIVPGKQKSFAQVKESIKEELVNDQAGDVLYQLSTEIADELSGGSTLEEIAKSFDLELTSATNLSADSKLKANLNKFDNFIETVFQTDEGLDSDLIPSEDELSYFVLRVDEISPERIRALDEVRGLVVASWKENEKKEKLAELARKTSKDIRDKSSSLEKKARQLDLKTTKSDSFYRSTNSKNLPEQLVFELFNLKVGDASNAYETSSGAYVIAKLSDISAAAKNDNTYSAQKVKDTIRKELSEDLLAQYLLYLRTQYPVEYKTN